MKKNKTSVASKPQKVQLTNKAGAFATPLESDVDAWLKMGWFCVKKTPVAGADNSKATASKTTGPARAESLERIPSK